jgi:hypothetical protein
MAADEDDNPQANAKAGAPKRPPRAPVTIDLAAEAVAAKPEPKPQAAEGESAKAEPGAAEKVEATSGDDGNEAIPPSAPVAIALAPPSGRLVGLLGAGIIGGLIALLAAFALQMSGVLPAPTSETATQGLQTASQASQAAKANADTLAALDKRIAGLEASIATLKEASGEVSGLAGRLTSLEADAKGLASRLDSLAQTPAAPSGGNGTAAIGSVLDDLTARLDQLESAAKGGDTAALSGLTDRLTALEGTVQGLSGRVQGLAAQPPAAASGDKAARAIAIAMLRQAAAKGGAFAGDLAMVETLGLDPGDLTTLKPLATKGAPSVARLADDFPAVADQILAASDTAGPDAGILERMWARARSLVTVRPVAPIPGSTPEAIVSRMSAAVRGGDLAAALAERAALPDPAKIVSSVWANEASDRVTIDKLVDKIGAAAAGGN